MATWQEFREDVVALLSVNYRRNTLRSAIDRRMRAAVLDLQSHIEEYREGHSNTYGVDNVESYGTASIGLLPDKAHIERMRFKRTGYICNEFPLEAHDWDARESLACCEGPLYKVAINPIGRQFMVNPRLMPGDQVVLDWNGRKSVFLDADEVPFDPEAADAVFEYVMSYLSHMVEKDEKAAALHMAAYYKRRKDLYLLARERKWMRARGDQETAKVCGPCGGPYDVNSAIEWVAFGDSGEPDDIASTALVAALAKSFQPDFVIHLGDTNYPDGDPVDLQDNFVKHFSPLFPSAWYQVMGNHDYDTDLGAALLAKIPHIQTLMDAEDGVSYCYQFTRGPVDFFVVNTGGTGADEIDEESAIPQWLTTQLAASDNYWKVVCMHKSPSSSESLNGSVSGVDWDALDLADVVISAHSHNYERLLIGTQPRLVVGTGGGTLRSFGTPVTGSQFRYNAKHGVLRCSADRYKLQFVFYNTDGTIVDQTSIHKP